MLIERSMMLRQTPPGVSRQVASALPIGPGGLCTTHRQLWHVYVNALNGLAWPAPAPDSMADRRSHTNASVQTACYGSAESYPRG